MMRETPVKDTDGRPFSYSTPGALFEMLHEIDRDVSGHIGIGEQVNNPNMRHRYIVNSLIEEAITSSQLEGASTTSQVARDMIRSGRKPTDRSERMILNNYRAMTHIRSVVGESLTESQIFALHRIVTRGTLDNSKAEGKLRTSEDNIYITDEVGRKLHQPPKAEELSGRLQDLLNFANGKGDTGFIHPVVRAIILHFWLAYDHPFVDGNGRTARGLFYWSMLSSGYWLFDFVSISHILRKAPSKYARSFLCTETDDNDLTYFILYQLKVIGRAVAELHKYLSRKTQEVKETERLIRESGRFNHRQLALLGHALRHPDATYSIQSHQNSHSVSYQTARTDLLNLGDRGYLTQTQIGNAYYFSPSSRLTKAIAAQR
jgi:Fic family protein